MKRITNNLVWATAWAVICAPLFSLLPGSAVQAQELNISSGEHNVHILPIPAKASELRARIASNLPASGPALTYNGGPVMTTVNTYAIYWIPSQLQNGASTGLSARYQTINNALLSLYPGHGLANNNTQYYEQSGVLFKLTDYIQSSGSFVASYVDTDPFPSSGCYDIYTGNNCLTDSQIVAEIQKVMTLKGWTGGLKNMFFMYTSSGEGSCSGPSCAYSDYCAYHSYFNSGSTQVIYANMPYADPAYCQVPATPSPNGDIAGDASANVTSHELTEAITDPLLNGWYSGSLDEIGDLCAWQYGSNSWDSGNANQSWPEFVGLSLVGNPIVFNFELQMEYDNHVSACVQLGP